MQPCRRLTWEGAVHDSGPLAAGSASLWAAGVRGELPSTQRESQRLAVGDGKHSTKFLVKINPRHAITMLWDPAPGCFILGAPEWGG